MSPMVSNDACMNERLHFDTAAPCSRPSYWTTPPTLRLCAPCFRARFGVDPVFVTGEARAASDSRSGPTRVYAQGAEDAGRDGGLPAPTTRATS